MSCNLKPIDQKFPVISLPDADVVSVGRGPTTRIKEARCSRNQGKTKYRSLVFFCSFNFLFKLLSVFYFLLKWNSKQTTKRIQLVSSKLGLMNPL